MKETSDTNPDQKPISVFSKMSALNGMKVTDDLGRVLTLRNPGLDNDYLLKAAMGDESANPACYELMAVLKYIVKIDELVLPPAFNRAELLANLARVGDAGYTAVFSKVMEVRGFSEEAVDSVKK